MIWLGLEILHSEPTPLVMLPFAVLLLSIAVAPMILKHHWERYYHLVCVGLSAIVCGYYIFAQRNTSRLLHAGENYVDFISVVAAFFVVAGGIHIRPKGRASVVENTAFLFLGAVLANVLGTIGASMLLIRPWIEMNKARFCGFHLAFFIFVVSNVGGSLLPVGPPLFLGYLDHVPFFWPLLKCWPHWLVAVGLLLSIFCLVDRRLARAVSPGTVSEGPERWRCFGKRNLFLMGVLLAGLIAVPPVWREGVMVVCAIVSYFVTPTHVHDANGFSFGPIKEIAWIFLGIFATMIPVLDYVELHASDLGVQSDAQFFWATGIFSAVLDNAPAYLTFLAGAVGLHGLDINNANHMVEFVARHDHSLIAVSLGATFFGALTYIGNGPNLLVKTIAQDAKVPTPGFFGFIFKYAAPVLLPIFVLLTVLFFHR